MYRDGEVRLDSLKLHFTEWGNPDNEPIVCVGGIMQEAHVWDLFAADLSRDYRVLCLDLRGQGDSDWTREGYSLDNYIRDIYSFLRRTGTVHCHFVGHSLGGRIAMAYAGIYKYDLRSIVLSDFGPAIEREAALGIKAGLEKYWRVNGFRDEDEALKFWQAQYPRVQPIFHTKYVQHNLRLNWANRLVPKADPDLFFLTTSTTASDLERRWQLAAKIECPTYLAWATNKEAFGHVSPSIVERMKREMSTLIVEEYDTGHSIFMERPEEFAERVRKFLKGVPAPAPQ